MTASNYGGTSNIQKKDQWQTMSLILFILLTMSLSDVLFVSVVSELLAGFNVIDVQLELD